MHAMQWFQYLQNKKKKNPKNKQTSKTKSRNFWAKYKVRGGNILWILTKIWIVFSSPFMWVWIFPFAMRKTFWCELYQNMNVKAILQPPISRIRNPASLIETDTNVMSRVHKPFLRYWCSSSSHFQPVYNWYWPVTWKYLYYLGWQCYQNVVCVEFVLLW
jgi:hypothetical protein